MSTDYKDLIAWQKSIDLVVDVYQLSSCFPSDERFVLTNQMRRSAVSIPSNIAEGQGRWAPGDFVRFLGIANGSRQELETQLILAIRLSHITDEKARSTLTLADEVGRVLFGLAGSIEKCDDTFSTLHSRLLTLH